MIEIEKITLYHLSMNLKKPFKNSIETLQERKFLIVEAIDTSGVTGWGKFPLSLRLGTPRKPLEHVCIC